MGAAVDHERSGHSGQLLAELEPVDGQPLQISVRNGEVAGLGLRFGDRAARDGQSRNAQALYLNVTGQQRTGSPTQGNVLGSQPDAARIAELQPAEVERCGKRAVQLRQLHLPSGEPGGQTLDEPATPIGVSGDEHRAQQQHAEQQ